MLLPLFFCVLIWTEHKIANSNLLVMNPFADQQASLDYSPIVTHFVWVCVYRLGMGNQLEEDKSIRKDNKF